MCDLEVSFWRDGFLNCDFALLHSIFKCQALQQGTLEGVVHENVPFSPKQVSIAWEGQNDGPTTPSSIPLFILPYLFLSSHYVVSKTCCKVVHQYL